MLIMLEAGSCAMESSVLQLKTVILILAQRKIAMEEGCLLIRFHCKLGLAVVNSRTVKHMATEEDCGGGMYCVAVPNEFKMRNIQFISCSANSAGGGFYFNPNQIATPEDGIYCYFLFFHECKCYYSTPYGHDMIFYDERNKFLNYGNPLFESYTTNTNEYRFCFSYNLYFANEWSRQYAEKRWWLKDKTIYVSVGGNDNFDPCGANTTFPCLTVKKALEMCKVQISLTVTLMEGNHTSETATIDIGEKKISVIGTGKEKSSIGTGALSSTGALFSVSTGHLGMNHLKVDCNSNVSPSPSVVVVSDGGGFLSLEDIVITTSKTGDYVMSSSVFVVLLSQLSVVDVEIKDMNVLKPLFSEQNLPTFSSPSSVLYLTATAPGDSVMANVKVTNVNLTTGDGVVVAKSVKEGETFVVQNVTIEDCECEDGSGGGIKVDLLYSTSKLRVGTSSAPATEATKFNRCNCSENGGGIMLHLEDGIHDFSILSVDFSGCTASLGGNYVFVNGSDSASWAITTTNLNVQHDNSKYNELVGYDRSDTTMGLFPLNVFLDRYPDEAHVGKMKDGLGGYDSWFCGFDYYPCATITHAAQVRYPDTNKKIELDSEFELAEVVGMADGHEWEISCATKGMEVGVKAPENFESSCLVEVLSKCSMRNIKFCIPSAMSGASSSSLITSNSTLLTLADCSVVCTSENPIGYCFVNVIGGKVKVEELVIAETLTFGEHSVIEFGEGVESIVFCGCEVNNIEKRSGDGGWVSGVVGAERDEGKNGIIVIESCVVKGCSCHGRGGGMCVRVKGEGSVVVNESCVIDGCEAISSEGSKGRGGGMMIVMGSTLSRLKIEHCVHFSVDVANRAKYGKDMFICCSSGILLESKVNASSFEFFDSNVIPSDILKLCGSEDGKEEEVIPLFVYLCSIGTKLCVDGSGERALDHSHCGFEEFGCLTIDYCVEKRASSNVNEIEVISESWIKNEMKVASFAASVSGKEEGIRVTVRDEGSTAQNNLIECTKSFEMRYLSFVLNEEMNGKRNAFIHLSYSSSSSSSTIAIASCSVSFGNDELIGYNVICVEGGGLAMNGFVMEGGVRMSGKSPIVISNGVELEMNNSRMSGMEVVGGNGGGGCLNVEMEINGIVNIEKFNLSSVCSGGSGMKGGGMMISVGKGGSLEMKGVKYSGCEVPRGDVENGGRGMGGGMFVEIPSQKGTFVLEGMIFEGCNAWKGKNAFVSGWDLSEVVNKENFKWEMSSEELRSFDELCGWERKMTGEEEYVIPLVVYLWRNWSGDGFVSREKGGDFSGCGYSEAPCSSIDHLISLLYPTFGEGETHIAIVGSGLLSHSISFSSSSSSISESPKVVIEGTKKGTGVTISDEDENDLSDDGSMISSNVSLSFVNVSFTKPAITTHHAVFIESSGANTLLSVSDCSFGSLTGLTETAGYCLMKVNGGSAVIERSSLSLISELKGLIAFSPSASEVTVQNVNISFAGVIERSLISMIDENQMNGDENTGSNGNRPVLRVVGCSLANITNEGIRASVVDVGSFENGVECMMDECSMSSCKSGLSTEGGGMRVVLKSGESVLKVNGTEQEVSVLNSSFGRCVNSVDKGSMMQIRHSKEVKVEICVFDGETEDEIVNEGIERMKEEGLCKWNGSLVDIENSNVEMRETTIMKSKGGGLYVSGGSVKIEKGEFENNNPSIEGYPSARRNVICTGSSELNVVSVKGGDGMFPNTSLWILNDGCELSGITSERASALFIPVLHEVKSSPTSSCATNLTLSGELLLPCNLTLKLCFTSGDEEFIELHEINKDGHLSENEIQTVAISLQLENVREETEVSLCLLFGNADSPSSTQSFILKNRSETKAKGDERIVERVKEGKFSWMLIVCIAVVFILLIALIMFIVRWKKVKNEAEDLREIVNDNIRKDPKAFEMVTMEMSPEEQWRRAEREAEKKNEERFKKRVYEKSLGHSESSEHLLSESGSTEYILGKDSDKIPEWALEKVEEEEIRKRSPSPSISSTCSTDSDSTFVRGEDLCPTTSSMSNLVDAMACSSPHEKLIVDLRDSLFMLLHGRNEKKEMAIGTLQEREQTAAQILFWVANLALHSFDEMENKLQSLSSLSPHIVLFSEHMVICIVMHSDFLSSDDCSDSSSISSLSVVSSSSNISVMSERFTDSPPPSSAFEDNDDIRKECLRWKAPELLMNKKMGATKESVAFSIGMMLWECLTLEIPFREYESEVAGQKIVNSERPNFERISTSSLQNVAKCCLSGCASQRPTLVLLKRELIQRFPPGAAVLTMTDAVECYSGCCRESERPRDSESRNDQENMSFL
ncbi:uncharacterized protein MONOS_9110 [Monocercomonoides exilis]|uniref:uncharacterized protein n=1 Tax=Monocercomonoides exilis TaxID=2049356 RepID=UPI003559A866|nr:hypothetical protein MONOS_9110 [Monocercomonoides exilis]|eukprot:MONOS_9110.1-p1 / transcript=MONOS_9110.1 / gene=MONOS_9110 / organism=Monocercomonoides_exilis_PA203 / gene_product=unspecified product / transcript_product=unspecified product / location=Mono_scaffold00365:40075-47813(+) / protein_length=2304 / sequence_SO=supercontig / SO=protein_coding / is_pseudo=false